jgi:hypothetical protein
VMFSSHTHHLSELSIVYRKETGSKQCETRGLSSKQESRAVKDSAARQARWSNSSRSAGALRTLHSEDGLKCHPPSNAGTRTIIVCASRDEVMAFLTTANLPPRSPPPRAAYGLWRSRHAGGILGDRGELGISLIPHLCFFDCALRCCAANITV